MYEPLERRFASFSTDSLQFAFSTGEMKIKFQLLYAFPVHLLLRIVIDRFMIFYFALFSFILSTPHIRNYHFHLNRNFTYKVSLFMAQRGTTTRAFMHTKHNK
jgi:hypothetical protein